MAGRWENIFKKIPIACAKLGLWVLWVCVLAAAAVQNNCRRKLLRKTNNAGWGTNYRGQRKDKEHGARNNCRTCSWFSDAEHMFVWREVLGGSSARRAKNEFKVRCRTALILCCWCVRSGATWNQKLPMIASDAPKGVTWNKAAGSRSSGFPSDPSTSFCSLLLHFQHENSQSFDHSQRLHIPD